MNGDRHWLLPVGVEEDLPPIALRIEQLRRRVLDLFELWGYDLVIPPLIEYLESLLITGDESLELQTLKLVDQLNGRMMGVRADMTPQVARIDARMPGHRSINRLCYAGTTLKARPDGAQGTRSLLQFGAEIYGDTGCDGEVEIIHLMIEALTAVGVRDVYIDLGHVGICSALSSAASLSERQKNEISNLLNRKAGADVRDYFDAQNSDGEIRDKFLMLLELNGGPEVLDKARGLLGEVPGVEKALGELIEVSERLLAAGITPHYDLAELRGYHYKTGIVFAAFTPGVGQEIARGGRYDNIGKIFGRARPATGFSGDLKLLADLVAEDNDLNKSPAVFVSRTTRQDGSGLDEAVAKLRAQGTRVIHQLHADDTPANLGCSQALVFKDGKWTVKEV